MHQGVTSRPIVSATRLVAIAVLAVIAVGTVGATFATTRPGDAARRSLVLTERTRDFNPKWSPDGRTIAFVRVAGPGASPSAMYLVNSTGGDVRLVTPLRRFGSLTWSPDARSIAFAADGIYVIKPDGSRLRRISRQGQAPAWGPGGKKIAFTLNGVVRVMNSDGSNVEDAAVPGHGNTYQTPSWSPDGERLAFFADRAQDTLQRRYLAVIDKIRGKVKRLLSGEAWTPAWSPSGRLILFSQNGGVRNPEARLYVLDLKTANTRRLHSGWMGHWSPDGNRIVFLDTTSSGDGGPRIFVMDADGSNVRQVTH